MLSLQRNADGGDYHFELIHRMIHPNRSMKSQPHTHTRRRTAERASTRRFQTAAQLRSRHWVAGAAMLEVASRACHVSRRPRTSVADDDLFYVRSRGPFSWLSLVCFEQGAIVASKTVSRLLSRGHSNSFNATAESLRTPSPLTFRSVSVAKALKQFPMHSLKTRRAFFFRFPSSF